MDPGPSQIGVPSALHVAGAAPQGGPVAVCGLMLCSSVWAQADLVLAGFGGTCKWAELDSGSPGTGGLDTMPPWALVQTLQ